MRKGRSHRRTRKSLPSKPQGAGTQLFVGVASAPPPSSTSLEPEIPPPAIVPSETSEAPREASVEAKAEEPMLESRAELPQDSLSPVVVAETPSEPPPAPEVPPQAGRRAEGAMTEAKAEEAPLEEPTPYVPEVAEKLAEAEAAPRADEAEAKVEAAPEPEPTPTPMATQRSAAIELPEEEDDATPPAVDLGAASEEFFEEGKRASERPIVAEETFEDLEKVKAKHLPHVVARRAKLARVVGWAVGIAGVVCLAAVARTAMTPSASASVAKNAVVAPKTEPVTAAQPAEQPKVEEAKPAEPAPAAEEPKIEAAKAEEAKAEPAKADEPKPADTKPAEAKPAEATPTVAAAQTGDKSAREEKRASQQALERAKLGEAIAAGERSVALDPGDAEAWLILGAAYQQKGDMTNARRAFRSCLEQGKRGPKGECAQFPH